MDVRSKKMTITTNARNLGMTTGRAVTYVLADPSWCILDGPPKKAPPWLPRVGQGAALDDGGLPRGNEALPARPPPSPLPATE